VEYLNSDCLAAVSSEVFRRQHPYPWLNMRETLNEEAFTRLCANMPALSLFNRDEGGKRA
jgi:hypothetical protein